jgi:hypothetical protein
MPRSRSYSEAVDFFLNPIPCTAVSVMVLNDHYLKRAYPGALTGKLSDFAGVFFFPLLFAAIWTSLEWVTLQSLSRAGLTRPKLLVGVTLTAMAMLLLKLLPSVGEWVDQAFATVGVRSEIVADPADLFSLTMLPLSYHYGKRYVELHSSK